MHENLFLFVLQRQGKVVEEDMREVVWPRKHGRLGGGFGRFALGTGDATDTATTAFIIVATIFARRRRFLLQNTRGAILHHCEELLPSQRHDLHAPEGAVLLPLLRVLEDVLVAF